MSLANTSVSAVIDYLLATLNADGLIGGAEVTVYDHVPKSPDREIVVLGHADMDSEWATIGARQRAEEYTLSCYVNVEVPGLTSQEARQRAVQLFGEIERCLVADPSFGGLATSAQVRPERTLVQTSDRGYEAEVQFGIRVKARVRSS